LFLKLLSDLLSLFLQQMMREEDKGHGNLNGDLMNIQQKIESLLRNILMVFM